MKSQTIFDLELLHLSRNPVILSNLVSYLDQSVNHKPYGFWVTVDGEDGWEDWCNKENFESPERRKSKNRITLAKDARILFIQNCEEFDKFDDEYGTFTHAHRWIDWRKVSQIYQGIVIVPYLWNRRLPLGLTFGWYYSWDCASGCIWDISAISEIQLIGKTANNERAEYESRSLSG